MHADSEDMQIIDIHLAEMAGWRALLSKAQFVAKLELHTMLEEYLVRMLYRTTRDPMPVSYDEPSDYIRAVVGRPIKDPEDLRVVGDRCLMFAGLFSEHAIGKDVSIAYFVKIGQAAYQEFGQYAGDPVFWMLSEFFVDVMDVLQTLREVEHDNSCIDPLNAYQLWHDTGSAHAWTTLQRITSALPGDDQSVALH